jgi:hypothetical protein
MGRRWHPIYLIVNRLSEYIGRVPTLLDSMVMCVPVRRTHTLMHSILLQPLAVDHVQDIHAGWLAQWEGLWRIHRRIHHCVD